MATGLDELLHEAEVAHGHLCAGQILGVRMAMLALQRLGIDDPRRRHDAAGNLNPDRKRVVTGCRVGKRALKLRDFGKMAATFVDLNAVIEKDEYKGLRVVALESSKGRAKDLYPELEKNAQQMKAYRELPDDELFAEQWVRVPLPPSEFPGFKGERVACARCGEGVNFDRFVERGDGRVCFACADKENLYYQPL
jgi:formylmethanofuran dehydrogenase subunit E